MGADQSKIPSSESSRHFSQQQNPLLLHKGETNRSIDRIIVIGSAIILILLIFSYFSAGLSEPSSNLQTVFFRFAQDLTPNLIPIPLLFLLSYYILREIREFEIKRQNEHLANTITSNIRPQFERITERLDNISSTQVGVLSKLSNDTVAKGICEARRSVKILQTWMGNFIPLEDSISTAISNGCQIQILLLNPSSPQAQARGKDMRYSDSQEVSYLINSNLSQLARIYSSKEHPNNIEVRLYNATPIMTLYWYDDICFLGVYWRNRPAIQGPQFEIHNDSNQYLIAAITAHFSDLWESSERVRLADFVTSLNQRMG